MPLLLSLSRGSKILKQIICEETVISQYLKDSILKFKDGDDVTLLKIIANISVDSKVFIDSLGYFK